MAGPSVPVARLEARGISRRFGAVIANDSIDMRIERGTVHAIIGGNGAGKSTLMRILHGMNRPDAGTVLVDGTPTSFSGPAAAFAHGIGMVHQEFMLVPGLTLLENLVLAHEPTDRFGRIDVAAARAAADALARQAGVSLDWDMKIEDAPIHVRQILEILRLLYRGADALILDEPTAVLAPAQVKDLIALLRKLRDEGCTVVFVSHKLDEILAVADTVTVLRNGKVVATKPVAQTTKAMLAEMMIGQVLASPAARPSTPGTPVLEVAHVTARDGRGHVRVSDLSMTVRAGEIVGIAGVAGNGQDELAAAVTGLGAVDGGMIRIAGHDATHRPLSGRRPLGLGYLSPDRAGEGLCLTASIAENTIASHHCRPAFCRHGILKRGAITRHVESLLDRYGVRRASAHLPIASLSGGNQQRVAVARELDGNPSVLVACQPTRGVDIHGIAFIHQCLLDFRDRGGAVLLVSEELDEVVALSDRILVLYGGRLTGEVARGSSGIDEIGRMMLGGGRPS